MLVVVGHNSATAFSYAGEKVLVQKETQEEFRPMEPRVALKSRSAMRGECCITKTLILKFNYTHLCMWGCSHELQQTYKDQRTTFRSWCSLYTRLGARGQIQIGKFGSKQPYLPSHLSPKLALKKKDVQFQTLGLSQ